MNENVTIPRFTESGLNYDWVKPPMSISIQMCANLSAMKTDGSYNEINLKAVDFVLLCCGRQDKNLYELFTNPCRPFRFSGI